ncbi:glutamyl-tRNA reductase [Marivirga atlantica]|jgi:glutamyl-tRNA reductase|uniref:Glutamyl-tRNA reductase n=1 Tax=Marivirga atlantica TaxID=1548457 RepID=A0A937DG20_9BACT|nr:glutamyl-tRNA reductase [Marivirga atlantica]MBL0764313.1 glutamyl-tRNA reductase [Marivirga atlantica]
MYQHFKALSLSFKNTPIHIREEVSLNETVSNRILNYLKEFTSATDVLILSTCNRTEIYYLNEADLSEDIIKLIGIEKGIDNVESVKPYFNSIVNHEEAVKHLFDVSIGLEAQVVGDIQISNQVKRAYQASADLDLAGPFLHRLMHTIFFTNKRVVQETPFRDGAASVSYAATELVKSLTAEISQPKVLVVGVGEIGEDVCRNLIGATNISVKITNRTETKARQLAAECNFETLDFDLLWEGVNEADVIISSVGADKALFTKEKVSALDILSFKYFIDLSIPRSVETEVEENPAAIVYNVDSIKSKADSALEKRVKAIPQVEQIIAESIEEFNDWSKEMIVSPTINSLKNALEQIRQEELARYLKNASKEQGEMVELVTKSMMQKIIKLPVLQLKAACKRGEAETLIDVLNSLFNLEKDTEKLNK